MVASTADGSYPQCAMQFEHRGHGYGKVITAAAAAALREMGSSSALVCTRSANAGAVATYKSAGFRQLPEAPDLQRGA